MGWEKDGLFYDRQGGYVETAGGVRERGGEGGRGRCWEEEGGCWKWGWEGG